MIQDPQKNPDPLKKQINLSIAAHSLKVLSELIDIFANTATETNNQRGRQNTHRQHYKKYHSLGGGNRCVYGRTHTSGHSMQQGEVEYLHLHPDN